jgi:hypothetical protein
MAHPYASAWTSNLRHAEYKETPKARLRKRPRSEAEDELERPAKRLQQTSASIDLSPLLTNFGSLGMPLPKIHERLADG